VAKRWLNDFDFEDDPPELCPKCDQLAAACKCDPAARRQLKDGYDDNGRYTGDYGCTSHEKLAP
jgi:hypothetical protein